uniref:Uncharacterized protein n=1 Tax=Nicotiana tabacum TaxID=4097 RepID=A0A1S3Z9I3_TOBAC|nr:PREDICTED: uncharacterized protein LOC107784420 [Nicotiana tabacum]
MAQEMESLREEVQNIRELVHLAVTTLPQPPSYPSLDSIPDHFPTTSRQNNNTPPSSPTSQTPRNPPITTNATHTFPHGGVTFTTNQHIPVVHIVAHERYVPLVYATSEPTFTALVTVRVPYEIVQYAKIEREARRKEEELVSEQLQILRKKMKSLQVARGSESLDNEDLCIHPDVDMPAGYKPPKFDIFDGTGDPHAYLRAYCDMLVGVGRNVKLRMKLFIRSLTGEPLTWYTRQDPQNWRTWQDMAEDFMNHF